MQQLGRYRILGELARGGMGVVYRAQSPDGRDVALKLLLPGRTEGARKRFDREANALARLDHPHVVRLLEYALTPGGEPYLVLELVEGESLQDLLSRAGKLPWEEAVELTLTLAAAVDACHAAGVLHRDLKPANVLLDRAGQPRLTDFGLTRDADPSSTLTQLTRTGVYLGSPGYWAPEQALGRLHQVGTATDVYGLAATLYALLSSRPPQEGETLQAMIQRLEELPPPPSTHAPDVPRWLDGAVLRALRPLPEERFATAAEFAQALRAGRDRGSARRSPLVWIALALILAGVLSAALIVVRARQTPQAASEETLGHTRRGQELLASQDYEGAVEAFSAALALEPESYPARCGRARANGLLMRFQAAKVDYNWALRQRTDDPETYMWRGMMRFLQDDSKGAIEDFSRAIELDPDLPGVYYNRGLAYQSRRELEPALRDYDRALVATPNSGLALFNRATVRAQLDDTAGGVEDLKRALSLEPDADWARVARVRLETLQRIESGESATDPRVRAQAAVREGDIQFQGGNVVGAEKRYQEAIDIDPRFAGGYTGRAQVRMMQGVLDAALSDVDQAILLDPQDPSGFQVRGAIKAQRGDLPGAERDFDESLRLDPKFLGAYAGRASVRFSQRKLRGALEDTDASLELFDPESQQAIYMRGMRVQIQEALDAEPER